MFLIRFAIFVMLALSFLPGQLAAQGPKGGEFVILNAQYGTESRHVDVTNRLKELARAGRPIRVDNGSFGVDPDRGAVKALRIFARGPNGREQMFEYREGSVVDGGQFRGWHSGEWGAGGWSGNWNGGGNGGDSGEYLILSAQYGTERRHVDVSNRLKELARADRPIRVDNGNFGVDPDRGAVKALRIFARGPNGREQMFEYREGSVVDGARFRGWRGGDWGGTEWKGGWHGGDH